MIQERQPYMRYRNKQVIIRLNDVEKSRLDRKAAKAKLTKSAYLRHLIDGVTPKEEPPHDYYQMMRQLYAIGNNLNQLTHTANATGQIDDGAIKDTLTKVRSAIVDITNKIVTPTQKGA
jgi:predicted DNA-binding protein